VKRFRGGLVVEAHRRLHHSTLGLRVIKKKKKGIAVGDGVMVASSSSSSVCETCAQHYNSSERVRERERAPKGVGGGTRPQSDPTAASLGGELLKGRTASVVVHT